MKRVGLVLALFVSLACSGNESPMTATSFEHASDLKHVSGHALQVVSTRSQFGSKSLKVGRGELRISNLRSLTPEESGAAYGSHFQLSPTFVMSLYNDAPVSDALRIMFNGEVYFDVALNFKGWRTIWVPFHEMEGNAPGPGDAYDVREARFVTPVTLWFDDIVFCQYVDDRHPYPGIEVPFIKDGGALSHDHWMPKLPFWNTLQARTPLVATQAMAADLLTVEERLDVLHVRRPESARGISHYRAKLDFARSLKVNLQVDPIRYEAPDFTSLRDFGKLMSGLANEYRMTGDEGLSDLFCIATEYYLDQGWAAGSSQGTIHHVGYSLRELHTAFFLMRGVLAQYGLLDAVGDSMRWQLNFGEVLDGHRLESNLDYYNTQAVFRLMACFLTNDPSMQADYLRAYRSHLSAALALTDSQGFRPDGTAWHHNGHYPAYALGAFTRLPFILRALSGTAYRIDEPGHANLKRAMLAAAIYSNPKDWGLGQAGRHPLGGSIDSLKGAFRLLALSGTPDGRQPIDRDAASAYVRLWGHPPGNEFAGIELDSTPPNGHWTFPYAALSVHRRNDWSVNIKGYNTYVWASEIYDMDNRYGRYQSNGSVQVLPNLPAQEAGYMEDGWDWNHAPGATAIERPFFELEPEEPLVMFKSEETYAGGCAMDGNGVWAMKLNEAAGYTIDPVKKGMSFPGNLRARKSVFCFGEQLLCLGTGIEADSPSSTVHTTLFQSGIQRIDDTVYHEDSIWLTDPVGTVYRIHDDSRIIVSVGKQRSPNNKYSLRKGAGKSGARANATGLFAKAWINHGAEPVNGRYAYSIYPMAGSREHIRNLPALEILRQDNRVHMVADPESKITAYAFFEAGRAGTGLLESVSVPCYVMIREGKGLKLAVANPNLNQKEDPVLGHYYGESQAAPVVLRLAGRWNIRNRTDVSAKFDGDSTLLTVNCIDGQPAEVVLEK